MSRLLRGAGALAVIAALAGMSPHIPSPVSRTLPNGLRVVVFPRPGLGVVQAQLQVAGGLRSEAAGHAGLALLTAQMIRQGTSSRSAEDFAVELDTLGATFATSVLRDAAQVAAGCRTQEFEGMLELVSDAVVNPLFSEDAFQAVRRQIAGQLGVQAQNPAALADERAGAVIFGAHPYGHPLYGVLSGLLSTSRDEVREFHRDHWRPDRAVLAIAGDIDPERAFASCTEWFGRWVGRSGADPVAAAPQPRRGVLLLDLPGSPVTEIRALALAPGRGASGYADWSVARELLEAGALPPGTRTTLVPAKEASMFMVSATARPESAAAVASRLRGAIRTLSGRTPSASDLAAARRRAAHGFPLSLESHGQLLASWLAGDAAGLPASHLASTPAALESANGAAALQVLGGELTLLIAGPAQRMRGTLASLGRVDTLREASEPDVAPVGLEVSAEQRRRGRQLADAALAAHGGAKSVRAVNGSYMDGELHMSIAGQEVTGEVRYLREDPDRLAYTTRLFEFEHRQVLDRSRGWSLSIAGDSAAIQAADSLALLSLRGILESDVVHILRDVADPKSDVFARGKETFEGKPVERIEFTNRLGIRTRLTLEDPSRRIIVVETAPTPQGNWRDRRRWSEFVQVDGVWWPKREVRELDGEKVSSVTFRRLIVNGAQDTLIFKKPIVTRGEIRGLEN